MDTMEYFEAEKAKHVARAQEVIEGAEREMRTLTDDERAEIKAHTDAAHSFNDKIKVERDNKALSESISQLANSMSSEPETVTKGKARTIGDAFVSSDAYQALKVRGTSGKFSIGPITLPDFGATAGIVTEGTGSNDDMFLPQRIPGIQGPVETPLGLTDLFGSGTITNGNSVLLVRETVTDNNAAVVPEGTEKPASDIGFSTEPATLSKIATVIKVSTEMLEDESAMLSYLNGRLATFVRQKREDILAGQLMSQANQAASAADVNGDNLFDAILAGAMYVRKYGGLDADAVAMTMLDWATLLAEKTSQDIYYSGGPFAGADQRLWGRFRVAITDRIGDGNVVVGAFAQGGTVWRKSGGVTVDATNSNEDDFLLNLTAIRAEERAVLFLQRPDAFCVVTETS